MAQRGIDRLLRLYALTCLVAFASCEDVCAEIPEDERFMCEQTVEWAKTTQERDKLEPVVVAPPGFSGLETDSLVLLGGYGRPDFEFVETHYLQCLDIPCLCNFFKGRMEEKNCRLPNGKLWKKAHRKEYRAMTDAERERFHAAINTLKKNGEYNNLIRIHGDDKKAPAAHGGPAFLPWHREFLKRMEILLREVDPDVALPFWDSSLDQALPDPADSIIFTDDFVGTINDAGEVVTGPFAHWITLKIRRYIKQRGSGLFKKDYLDELLKTRDTKLIFAFAAPSKACPHKKNGTAFEMAHGLVHVFVGGKRDGKYGDMRTAANDPIFFLHHTYIDKIWELWRLNRQDRRAREFDYPESNTECCSKKHFHESPLLPFQPLWNRHGLSNMYTDQGC